MKTVVKDLVGRTAKNRFAWFVYRGCGRLSDYFGRVYGHARWARQVKDRDQKLLRIVRELFPTLTVAHGPFRGLRYPAAESYGSMLMPKLLGSYESELHPVLEELFANDYKTIVDIGCAEGYYAIGLGRKFVDANVYAFDTSPTARRMCAEMAALNGVENRVHIGGMCEAQTLKSIPLGERALIISDCEGYENTLFSPEMAALLANHDLIIEMHDFIDIEISSNLRRVFSTTHKVDSIRSRDDIEKAHTYQYAELSAYSTGEKRTILEERRPGIMEWQVMRSLKSVHPSAAGPSRLECNSNS